MFSGLICPNTSPQSLFRQIWSQKLKFSKLIKVWYRSTLLYPYFKFNVYFSKIVVTLIYLGEFVPKIWSSLNLLKFGTGAHGYILITILKFIFPKFLLLMLFGQIWSHNLVFFKLTKGCTLLYAYYSFNRFFFQNSLHSYF